MHPYFYIGSNEYVHTEEYTAVAGMCHLYTPFLSHTHAYIDITYIALIYTHIAVVASGGDKAQYFTLRTAKALAMTALDVVMCPDLLQRVKQDFTEAKLKEDSMATGGHTGS